MPDSLEGMSAEQITQLARMQAATLTNPETRKQALKLYRQVNPHTPLPEVDLEDRIASVIDTKFKEAEERESKRQMEHEARLRDDLLRSLARDGLLTEDDVRIDEKTNLAPIEQFMIDHKVADHRSAAKFMRAERQAAIPSVSANAPQVEYKPIVPKIDLASGNTLRDHALNTAFQAWNEVATGKVKLDRTAG